VQTSRNFTDLLIIIQELIHEGCQHSAVKVGLLSQVHVNSCSYRHQSVATLAPLNVGSRTRL